MSKMLEIKVNELENTDVGWVALVHKGANRIPFRLTKSDGEPTMDLYSLGKRIFKTAPAKPMVIAAIVNKTANLDDVKAALTASGLSIEKMSEQDDLIVFQQADAPADDKESSVVKIDENVALVVTGLQKMFSDYNFDSINFNEMMQQEGFWPSICVAKDVLHATISNIMYEANTAGEAKDAINKAVADFSAYIAGIVSVLPEKAFKADVEIAKAGKGKGGKGGWTEGQSGKELDDADDKMKKGKAKKEQVSQSPTHGNETDTSKPGGANDPAIETDPAHGNETPPASGGKQKPLGVGTNVDNDVEEDPAVSKSENEDKGDDPVAALAKQIATLSETLTTSVNAVKSSVDGIGSRMDKVEGRLAKAEEAVHGTVAGGEQEDDRHVTQKSEGRKVLPLLDTAIMKVDDEAA